MSINSYLVRLKPITSSLRVRLMFPIKYNEEYLDRPHQIECVKKLREYTELGLSEARRCVENLHIFGVKDEAMAVALDEALRPFGWTVFKA